MVPSFRNSRARNIENVDEQADPFGKYLIEKDIQEWIFRGRALRSRGAITVKELAETN
jgi:hypothetical protein